MVVFWHWCFGEPKLLSCRRCKPTNKKQGRRSVALSRLHTMPTTGDGSSQQRHQIPWKKMIDCPQTEKIPRRRGCGGGFGGAEADDPAGPTDRRLGDVCVRILQWPDYFCEVCESWFWVFLRFFLTHVFFCLSRRLMVRCMYTPNKHPISCWCTNLVLLDLRQVKKKKRRASLN